MFTRDIYQQLSIGQLQYYSTGQRVLLCVANELAVLCLPFNQRQEVGVHYIDAYHCSRS